MGSYDQMLRVLNHLTWKTFAEFMHLSTVRGPGYAAVFKVFLFYSFHFDDVAVYEMLIYIVTKIAGSR